MSHAVAPLALWNLPASHPPQADAPVLLANVPGAHGVVSVEPIAHAEPAGQTLHSLAAVSAGVLDHVPAGQLPDTTTDRRRALRGRGARVSWSRVCTRFEAFEAFEPTVGPRGCPAGKRRRRGTWSGWSWSRGRRRQTGRGLHMPAPVGRRGWRCPRGRPRTRMARAGRRRRGLASRRPAHRARGTLQGCTAAGGQAAGSGCTRGRSWGTAACRLCTQRRWPPSAPRAPAANR